VLQLLPIGQHPLAGDVGGRLETLERLQIRPQGITLRYWTFVQFGAVGSPLPSTGPT
jgi:hypothetical protein